MLEWDISRVLLFRSGPIRKCSNIGDSRSEALVGRRNKGVSISRIGQVQVIFRAGFAGEPRFGAGPESEAVGLFAWDDIPWDDIAFPSVHWALEAWRQAAGRPLGAPASTPANHSPAPLQSEAGL